jgi:cell division protein FtsZ
VRREQPEVRVVRSAPRPTGTEPDYRDLDRPAIQRRRAVGQEFAGSYENEEMLDIPAFLRRQAD